MSGDHAACGAFPCSAVHRNALFLLKALQHALSRSFIKISEKRPRLFLYALPELLPALFFILALHLFPFAHDIFDVHLTGDLLFHRALFRHHHTDLPVIFLRKVILIICLSMLISFTGDIVTLLFFRRPYFFHGSIVRRRKGLIRSFHILPGILRFRRLPGWLLINLPCIFRLLMCRLCINLLLRCLCGRRSYSRGCLPPFLHQLLHARSKFLLQINGIVFSHIHGLYLDVHLLSVPSCRFLLRPAGRRSILLRLFRYSQSLSAHHIGVKLLLLGRRKRLMKRLQLHGLHHIFSFSKPEDQLVTFLYAFGRKSHPMIQIRQLIGPLLPVVLLLKLLKNGNPFLQPHILRFIELILKNISTAVVWRDLHKILIIFNRMNHIAHPDRQITQRIYNHPAGRMTLIRHLKQEFRILKSPVYLVYVTDRTEHHHALHPRPVNGIRNLCRFRIFFL